MSSETYYDSDASTDAQFIETRRSTLRVKHYVCTTALRGTRSVLPVQTNGDGKNARALGGRSVKTSNRVPRRLRPNLYVHVYIVNVTVYAPTCRRTLFGRPAPEELRSGTPLGSDDSAAFGLACPAGPSEGRSGDEPVCGALATRSRNPGPRSFCILRGRGGSSAYALAGGGEDSVA